MKHIFSIDNALHAIVAVAFVIAWSLFLGGWVALPCAFLAGLGLYLREASQVDWDWTLQRSFHKHMEWAVGTVCGFIAALVCWWFL